MKYLRHTLFNDEETCVHEFPDDWQFGGPNGSDPRADPRWSGSTYMYFDDRLRVIHITQVPICDNEAIDYFSTVASWGPEFSPRWVHARRPDERVVPIPVEYSKLTDSFEEI